MKKITEKEELNIYRGLLIQLHTCIWTGHNDKVNEILKAIGEYSYARTNSNGDWKQEEELQIITLMNLKKLTE
jgi:G:T-mismatch repair DNA endonuclease (very short patch repair protein)